jgi:hypothetical protein
MRELTLVFENQDGDHNANTIHYLKCKNGAICNMGFYCPSRPKKIRPGSGFLQFLALGDHSPAAYNVASTYYNPNLCGLLAQDPPPKIPSMKLVAGYRIMVKDSLSGCFTYLVGDDFGNRNTSTMNDKRVPGTSSTSQDSATYDIVMRDKPAADTESAHEVLWLINSSIEFSEEEETCGQKSELSIDEIPETSFNLEFRPKASVNFGATGAQGTMRSLEVDSASNAGDFRQTGEIRLEANEDESMQDEMDDFDDEGNPMLIL